MALPGNRSLNHQKGKIDQQGERSGWQRDDAEPSHHAKDIKGLADIETEDKARSRRALIYGATAYRRNNRCEEYAKQRKDRPGENRSKGDCVSGRSLHALQPMRLPRISKHALLMSLCSGPPRRLLTADSASCSCLSQFPRKNPSRTTLSKRP
jgi:hypothetical protein